MDWIQGTCASESPAWNKLVPGTVIFVEFYYSSAWLVVNDVVPVSLGPEWLATIATAKCSVLYVESNRGNEDFGMMAGDIDWYIYSNSPCKIRILE